MSEKSGMEKEISDLRTELYEARNLVIKSDNLLRTLHAEVKSVGRAQERFAKKQLYSGITAYCLFALICAGAAFMVVNHTIGTEREEMEKILSEASQKVEAAEEMSARAVEELEIKLQAEKQGAESFKLLQSDCPQQLLNGLELFDSIDSVLLPSVMRDIIGARAEEVRRQLVNEAWERGRRAYLAEKMEESVEDLELITVQAGRLPPDFEPGMIATAGYYLGAAKNRLGEHREAVRHLEVYIDSEHAARNTLGYAHLLLGDSLMELDRFGEAAAIFALGLEKEPGGRHVQALRSRLASLEEDDE